MAAFDDKLVVGGYFTGMNGQPVSRIGTWDGQGGVVDLGADLNFIETLDVMPYGSGVVFGGRTMPDSRKVYSWDGTSVAVIGEYTGNKVNCFAEFNGDLIVGGTFLTMDGVQVDRIARWDGTAWSPLGPGLNEEVNCLAVFDGQLYAGGRFTATADGNVELARVARWDGSEFQPCQSGLDKVVTDLEVWDGDLIIGGAFGFSGDSSVVLDRYARWTGSSLDPLVSGATVSISDAPLLVPMGDHGLLVRLTGRDDLILRNGDFRKAWIRGVACTQEFQGELYAGGDMEADSGMMALARILPGTGHTELEVAGMRMWIRSDGVLCYDAEQGDPRLIPVDHGGASTVFASGHYVVGYVGDSAFTSCWPPYGQENYYGQGPRCEDRTLAFKDRFRRTWPVDIGMLWEHAANLTEPGYEVPEVIASWPVQGDAGNGEPSLIANFQDMDGDGVYEPEEGDMPAIKGDKAVLVSVSDQKADTLTWHQIHPSMFDSQILVHGYNANIEPALYETVFVSYTFTNRSDRQYDSVVVALHSDADIGGADDDFIGCDPELDMFYVYNADPVDETQSGAMGFGEHPPALGVVGLGAPMRSFIYFNREGPNYMTDPQTTLHAARYAEGVWKDGSPIINMVTNEPTRYMFNEYPDVPGGYHETVQQSPDRRGTASFGPFFDVAPGERICFDMAFVFASDTTQDNIQNTRVLQQKVIALKEWYAQQGFGCDVYQPVGLIDAAPVGSGLAIYPNPASDLARLSRTDARENLMLGIHSSTGQLLRQMPWASGSTDLTIDLRLLADGVYVIRLQGAEGKVLRLVVAH